MKHILVTGAVGKVGAHFIHHILQSKSHKDVIRALCHNRVPEPLGRLEIVKGAKPYIPAASALRQVEDIRVTPCSGLFPLTPALSLRFPSPIGWERGQG